jgi:hypothetical protein
VNDHIINIGLKTPSGYLMMVGVCAPEEGRKEESIDFYESLQSHLNSINISDYLAMRGDFSARVGQQPIETILGTHGKNILS